jgi:protein O-GlcNAc transferase
MTMASGKVVGSAAELIAAAAHHLLDDDPEAAIATLGEATRFGESDMLLHFVTALVAWYLGDLAKALALTRTCHDQAPMNGTVAEILASLYAQSGDLLESLYFGKLATALGEDAVISAWVPARFPSFGQAFLSIQDKPLLAQARFLLANGKVVEALDKARQHVDVAAEDDEGRLFYTETLLRAGQGGIALDVIGPLMARASLAPAAASLLARTLAAGGEAAAARRWHDQACSAAPDDAAIAAARVADAPWLGVDRQTAAAWAAEWTARFTKPAKLGRRRPVGDRLVIGYLVSHFPDRADAAAVAAVASMHERPAVMTIGYGVGPQIWDENAPLRGAFDKWRDVTGIDPATLARTISADEVDILIDAGGFASPVNLQMLARVNSAVRVAWLGETGFFERTLYDATLSSRRARTPASGDVWTTEYGSYPLLRDWTGARQRTVDAACRFGADARFAQLDGQTVALWCAILAATPHAVLLLRVNDLAQGTNIARLIERFGRDLAARIDVLDAAVPDDLYRQVDVALVPLLTVSPRPASEAIACGVPLIALGDGGSWQSCAALLRDVGLDDLVMPTPQAYIERAVDLAALPAKRAEAASRMATLADGAKHIPLEIAKAIELAGRAALGKAAA